MKSIVKAGVCVAQSQQRAINRGTHPPSVFAREKPGCIFWQPWCWRKSVYFMVQTNLRFTWSFKHTIFSVHRLPVGANGEKSRQKYHCIFSVLLSFFKWCIYWPQSKTQTNQNKTPPQNKIRRLKFGGENLSLGDNPLIPRWASWSCMDAYSFQQHKGIIL